MVGSLTAEDHGGATEYNMDNLLLELDTEDNTFTDKASKVIASILAASRSPETRVQVSEERHFKAVLSIYRNLSGVASDEQYNDIVKCICNLSADNDNNRQLAIEDERCLAKLIGDLAALPQLSSGHSRESAVARANIALATLFNICKDYEPAQKACFKSGLQPALQGYIAGSITYNEDHIGLATDLWSDILNVREGEPLDGVSEAYVRTLFWNIDKVTDDETRNDLLVVLTTQVVSDPGVQRAVLEHSLVGEWLDLLQDFVSPPDRQLSELPSLKQMERAMLRCLTDISQLQEYPLALRPDEPSLQRLYQAWWRCGPNYENGSLSVCAFTLLANLITNDQRADQVTALFPVDDLIKYMLFHLGPIEQSKPDTQTLRTVPPAEKEYFYTATHFLRQSAALPQIRNSFNTNENYLDVLDRLLQSPDIEVAEAALQLYNRTLETSPSDPAANIWRKWDIGATQPHKLTSWTLSSTIHNLALKPDLHIRLKLELGLVYLSYLRAAVDLFQKDQTSDPGVDSFAHLSPDLWTSFGPVILGLVTQRSVPKYWVQGFLGLVLLTSLPRGAAAVQGFFLNHTRSRRTTSILPGDDAQNVTAVSSDAGSQDPRAQSKVQHDDSTGRIDSRGDGRDILRVLIEHITYRENPSVAASSAERIDGSRMDTVRDTSETSATATTSASAADQITASDDGAQDEAQNDGAPAVSPQLRARARDNAIVLLCQLLRSREVDGVFRQELVMLADGCGIKIPAGDAI